MATATSVEQVIRQKLTEIEGEIELLRHDRSRLERALHALEQDGGKSSRSGARATPAARTRRTRRSKKAGSGRAPRGSNLSAIVAYVEGRPGATTAQIAQETGIAKTVVYSAVGRLVASKRLRREQLPDRQVAYHAVQQ